MNRLKKALRPIIWTTIVILLTILIVSGFILSDPITQKKTEDFSAEIQQIRINPEIKILTDYMMLRNQKLPLEVAQQISEILVDECQKSDVNVSLINAMIERESGYNVTATSPKGAKGLMQILGDDSVKIDPKQAYNIRYNMQIGITILKHKMKISNGELSSALSKYSGNADDYVSRVYENVGRYTLYTYKISNGKSSIAMD